MGRKLYAKGEGFNPTTSIEDVEGLREELDALKGGSGGGDNTAIERRLTTAEGEIDDLQRDVAEQSEEVATVGAKVNTLQGTDEGKSVRTIAAEETAKIVGNAPANYDTLKEIADYIATDATGAAELSNKVNKNTTDIAKVAEDLSVTHQLASNAESAISEVVELTIPAIESDVANKATKGEAQGYATTAKNEAIAAAATDATAKANKAKEDAIAEAEGLDDRVYDYCDEAIADAIGHLTTDGQVADNAAAIEALEREQNNQGLRIAKIEGSDAGKSARTIAAEEVAKVVASAPEDFDTLKEIAAYIESDKTGAAQMNNAIAQLNNNKLDKTGKAADSAKADYATSAGSATKLATPRTIWGQNFDGSGNVRGDIQLLNKDSSDGNASSALIEFSGGYRYYGPYIKAESSPTYGGYGRKDLKFYQRKATVWPTDYSNHFVAMIINAIGNVGIGTTSPSEKLDVAGNIKASGNVSAKGLQIDGDVVITGNVVIEGNITSGASYQSNPLSTISEDEVPSVEQQLRSQISSLEERIATLEQLIAQNNG